MASQWKPIIQKDERPLYMALVKALSDDIVSGRLPKGSRLPTQRELADELKIAIGTITHAYDEAERRGLVYGDGRRGTFVGEMPGPRSHLASMAETITIGIDFSKNHPAQRLDPSLSAALFHIARSPECPQLLAYPSPPGSLTHRQAGARWMETLGLDADPENVSVCGGAQHGVLAVLAAETRPGDIIALEEYTYPGVKAAADMLGLQHIGVPIDQEGIIPEALEAVCGQKDVRLLYCNPSMQNPTNAVMSLERRRQIAELAQKHNIYVVEDEILSPLLDQRPGFLAGLIPERCYFIVSASKSVAAGLRVGFIAAPEHRRQKLADSLQTSNLGQPPLMAEIFARWLDDGTVEKTIARRKRELAWAQQTGCEVLKDFKLKSHPSSYHIWLELPDTWTSLSFTTEAQMRGVAVTPAETFAVSRKLPANAVRISLGGAPDRAHLKTGLEIIAEILSGSKRQEIATV